MTDPIHARIIINQVSGPKTLHDRKATIQQMALALGWKGQIVETSLTKSTGDLARAALQKGITHLVVCGGDGTIMDVLTAATNQDVVVGIVPLGTDNLFAANLAIPTVLDEALKTALFGKVLRVDVGRANDHYFSIMAGMGLDADMIRKADRKLKNTLGLLAYIIALFHGLRKPRRRYRVHIDNKPDRVYKAKSILVANMGKITGGIEAVPNAHPQNGKLYIGVIHANTLPAWLSLITNALFHGNINKSPGYTLLEGKNIEIQPLPGPRVYECDGEVFPATDKLVVTILPKALSVLVQA